jgi:molybdate transport system substrate-binding protein
MRHLSSATIALLLATASRIHAQGEVTLISPGSVQPSIEELIPVFEAKTARKVAPTFASGGVTRQQVMRGEIFDVIILQPPYPEVLATGNVNVGSATTLATVALGIAGRKGVPKPDISTPEAVKRVLLASKGVAYPDEPGGASGIAFLKVLDKLGIRQEMEPKLKHGGTGGSTMELVVSGEADYGVTFMSGMNRPGVEAIGAFPAELAPPTGYVGFLSSHAKDPVGGKALLDYLASPAAAKAYTSRGFQAGSR